VFSVTNNHVKSVPARFCIAPQAIVHTLMSMNEYDSEVECLQTERVIHLWSAQYNI